MKIINAGYEILRPHMDGPEARNAIYQLIEQAGRTCYKSESAITPESAAAFVQKIVKNHHEAMLEHASMTVKFIVDRGVSHELVRHRLASFAQESTRYCNYSKDKFDGEVTFIQPLFFEAGSVEYMVWKKMCQEAENTYLAMLQMNRTPQEARSVLPNSLKTEVIMTANMREWRHFFRLRTAGETGAPHPQMAEVAVPLLREVQAYLPELFGDIKAPEG
ncbi:MAG: FAD-dependent thymidylate synthase [Stomatobaculum sp.]|nr:FAD-dependent thymidylate synthase [Stomatobaculum sp.]